MTNDADLVRDLVAGTFSPTGFYAPPYERDSPSASYRPGYQRMTLRFYSGWDEAEIVVHSTSVRPSKNGKPVPAGSIKGLEWLKMMGCFDSTASVTVQLDEGVLKPVGLFSTEEHAERWRSEHHHESVEQCGKATWMVWGHL